MYRQDVNLLIFLFFASYFSTINGLYEDQVGKFDWKKSFIGKPKHAHIENNKIYVATDENVLACLNKKTGDILWRQLLENDEEQHIQYFKLIKKGLISISGNKNTLYVRGWEPKTGTLQWEWLINTEKVSENHWSIYDNELIQISLTNGNNVNIISYHMETGEIKKTEKVTLNWRKDEFKCASVKNYFGCIVGNDESFVEINFLNLRNLEIQKKSIEFPGANEANLLEFEIDHPAFSIIKDNQAKIIHFINEKIEMIPKVFSSNVIQVDSIFYQLEINLNNPEKLLRIIKFEVNGKELGVIDVEYPRGLGAPYIISGENDDLLLVTMDHTLIYLKLKSEKIEWTREESLVNIVACEFFELPVSEHDASIENEFNKTNGNVLNMFIHRISTQMKQFSNFISFGSTFLKNNLLVRDDFGLHKIIVLVTKIGKIFGIDTITGTVVWTYRLPYFTPFDDTLLVQRTSRYSPLNAQCTILGKDQLTGNTVIFQFDPITGKSNENGLMKIKKIKQVMLLPYEDDDHLKPFITINQDHSIGIYPEKAKENVRKHLNSIHFYIVDDEKITGYGLEEKFGEFQISPRWNFIFGPAKLVGISCRPNGERVHSQGRVLPDRSVYYKYVNPNMIAVATVNDDPIHKQVLTVYMLDGITGFVIHSVVHKRIRTPINLAHSENWLVYTFFNEKYRRTELASLELYEGHVQSNSTVFSSYAMSQLPQIQTQSYILPSTPSKLTVTLTERGITNKCILMALNTGSVIEIPWGLIQPRFADIPCGPEESCYPYMPELPIQPEATINYNQTLSKIKEISVAPARLESTSHVLVYGLDMFYTRVAPSKTFDVLKEDFDHKLIVLVLIGLIGTSYITRMLAAKKAIKQAWK